MVFNSSVFERIVFLTMPSKGCTILVKTQIVFCRDDVILSSYAGFDLTKQSKIFISRI